MKKRLIILVVALGGLGLGLWLTALVASKAPSNGTAEAGAERAPSPLDVLNLDHVQVRPAVEADRVADTVFIGSRTNSRIEDLRAAASVLRGHKVASGVQLLVAPASAREQAQAEREGVMQVLRDAGAEVLGNSCGACAGYGATFGEGATVISSTARNFKGRMGPASVQVYLASPYTVAASALRGRIADPREVLA